MAEDGRQNVPPKRYFLTSPHGVVSETDGGHHRPENIISFSPLEIWHIGTSLMCMQHAQRLCTRLHVWLWAGTSGSHVGGRGAARVSTSGCSSQLIPRPIAGSDSPSLLLNE
jgi:hypothetical protein